MPTRSTGVRGRVRLLARMGGAAAVAETCAVFVLYFLLALLSYRFAFSPDLGIAVSWPPSGIALAALVRRPMQRWPLFLVAIGLAVTLALVLEGVDPLVIANHTAADLVEPLVGATLIRRAMPTVGLPLLRTREVGLLILYGGFVGPLAGTAVVAAGSLLRGGFHVLPTGLFAVAWWTSAALGAIDIGPLLLAAPGSVRGSKARRLAEAFLIGIPTIAFTVAGFLVHDLVLQLFALAIAAYPLLAVLAIRFGPAGAAWGSTVTSVIGIYLTMSGEGPFAADEVLAPHTQLMLAQGFFVLATLTVYFLAALAEERRRAFRIQQMLADAGVALATMEPQESRLQKALQGAVDAFGDAAVLWRDEERQPIAFARATEARPIADEVAQLRSEPADATTMRCDACRCWLLVPLRQEPDASLGMLAVRATKRRRYFDSGEVALVQNLAYRLTLAIERDRLVAEADRLYREAAEAVHLRDQFLSIASHELKTPLTPLAARLELMRRRVRSGQQVEISAIEKAQTSLGKLTWLINDLLDVSRIQAGTLDLQRQPTSLREVIRTAIAAVGPEEAGRIRFLQPPQDLVVDGDANRLEQVVANLLDNALKYSPAGRDVEVALRREGEEAVISVIDRGLGIPREETLHLFERFFRARNVSPARYGGLGLGLYIVRDIVERHGGRIWAESEEGRGSAFHVALPLLRVGSSPDLPEESGAAH